VELHSETLSSFSLLLIIFVIKFIGRSGFIRKYFLNIVHIKDITALNLKKEISSVLSHHNLDIQNFRGQWYNGACNMYGEWNGLQVLFIKDCLYVYYVYCLAHQLQLTLIVAAREVSHVHTFFYNMIFIVNVISQAFNQLQLNIN